MAFPNWDCCCDSVFACDEDCFPEWDCCGGNSSCDVGWCCTLVGGSDYELPTASEYIKGGVMIGEGLKIDFAMCRIGFGKGELAPTFVQNVNGAHDAVDYKVFTKLAITQSFA